jgi:hypothetical protein
MYSVIWRGPAEGRTPHFWIGSSPFRAPLVGCGFLVRKLTIVASLGPAEPQPAGLRDANGRDILGGFGLSMDLTCTFHISLYPGSPFQELVPARTARPSQFTA